MSKPEDSGLERDYCAGLLSNRKLAEKYGISEGAIRKRAIKNNWVRAEKSGTQKSTQVRKTGTQKKEVRTTKEKAPRVKKNTPVLAEEIPEEPEEKNNLPPELSGLSQQQIIFAQHAGTGKTRVEAYRLAGYLCEGDTAYAAASRLYRNVKVARAVRYFRDKHQQRYTAELDEVIHQLVSITRADPNDLAQYRRVNCRYCWGENHFFQWRDIAEFDKAAAAAAKDGKNEPEYGGIGFIDNADPHPECPRCHGEGKGEAFFADTRDLEGDARYLLQGVKLGKFGIEINTSDKDAARRELARLLIARGSNSNKEEMTQRLLELEIRKRAAEAERMEQEAELRRKGGNGDEKPTIVIKLVNSPDDD